MTISRHVGACRRYAAHNNQLKAGDGTYNNQLKAERKGGGGGNARRRKHNNQIDMEEEEEGW